MTAERCLLRAQGDLVRVEPDRPGVLEFTQTAAAAQAAILKAGGAGRRGAPADRHRRAGLPEPQSQHAAVRGGGAGPAVEVDAGRTPAAAPHRLRQRQPVRGRRRGVLIRTRGGQDQEEFLDRVDWIGAGVNRYLLDRFWIASGTTTEIRDPAVSLRRLAGPRRRPRRAGHGHGRPARRVTLERTTRPLPAAADPRRPGAPARPAAAPRGRGRPDPTPAEAFADEPAGADADRLPPPPPRPPGLRTASP